MFFFIKVHVSYWHVPNDNLKKVSGIVYKTKKRVLYSSWPITPLESIKIEALLFFDLFWRSLVWDLEVTTGIHIVQNPPKDPFV
ncbi:hypothetical protein JCM31447_00280 [Fluviispira sanaruensis]|uniref:Uncharacterized protein n=1 Tax=Fluviispira sanaruensis TaxID=2493639 RepID=A0A4P2VFQ7_FLUSA|nr:hypothetical protein JCM31447_00280 [Fluviispira sanaruensis]